MNELDELEKRIEFAHALWDREIDSDARGGKLNSLVNEALADYKAGKSRQI